MGFACCLRAAKQLTHHKGPLVSAESNVCLRNVLLSTDLTPGGFYSSKLF